MSENVWEVGTGKDYATITLALVDLNIYLGSGGDLSALNGGVQYVNVYGNQTDGSGIYPENVDLTGLNTSSASDYVHLRAMVNHNGLAQESGGKGIKIIPQDAFNYKINLIDYCKISGFEISDCVTTQATSVIYCGAYCEIYNNVICANTSTNAQMYVIETLASCLVCNNIIYRNVLNQVGAGAAAGIYINGINCVVDNNSIRTTVANAPGTGDGIFSTSGTSKIVNNICGLNFTSDFQWQGTETQDNSDYNISVDNTADNQGGGHCIVNAVAADLDFVSTIVGSEDLHIETTSVANNAGINLTSDGFTFDVDHDTRPVQWSIGADEPTPVTINEDGVYGLLTDDGLHYLAFCLKEMADGGAPFANQAEIALGIGDTLVVETDEELEEEIFVGSGTYIARKGIDIAQVEDKVVLVRTSFGLGECNNEIDNLQSTTSQLLVTECYEVGLFNDTDTLTDVMIGRVKIPAMTKYQYDYKRLRMAYTISFERY